MIISVVEADDFIEIAASFVVCTENIVVCCETKGAELRHNYGSER